MLAAFFNPAAAAKSSLKLFGSFFASIHLLQSFPCLVRRSLRLLCGKFTLHVQEKKRRVKWPIRVESRLLSAHSLSLSLTAQKNGVCWLFFFLSCLLLPGTPDQSSVRCTWLMGGKKGRLMGYKLQAPVPVRGISFGVCWSCCLSAWDFI